MMLCVMGNRLQNPIKVLLKRNKDLFRSHLRLIKLPCVIIRMYLPLNKLRKLLSPRLQRPPLRNREWSLIQLPPVVMMTRSKLV